MRKAQTGFSSRAPILSFVLECINARLYDDQGDYMIFGSDRDEILEEATHIESKGSCRVKNVTSLPQIAAHLPS